jgi:uncharacterized protein (DUF1330 family)
VIDRSDLAAEYGLATDAIDLVGAGPLTVVNLFELNEIARYPSREECPGVEAMRRYGSASGPCLEAAGGTFLSQALPTGVLWGDDDGPWHLLVVASYPDAGAFWSLLADPAYRRAFAHRRAAVARQRVVVGATL